LCSHQVFQSEEECPCSACYAQAYKAITAKEEAVQRLQMVLAACALSTADLAILFNLNPASPTFALPVCALLPATLLGNLPP
jgi:hypothetical protein